ncbi:hypothetical protein [Paenibacillus sp. OV219]|uniref:hypothetical protein n=1 Tax=Paenibacillus sp. OV219 TaxID=1884377 RepID=UPI0008C88D66|nr:hypothetical protein [Paenibacillus sp. OV219]SEO56241.1 hypothetical protein SAMN05518847_108258 [Paenibacillus sp. OV219]
MAIQFLDMRLSVHSNESGGTTAFSSTPLLIGDIGLQTAGVSPFNVSTVRALLTGTASVAKVFSPTSEEEVPDLTARITITVERNGTGTAGTGTVILEEVVQVGAAQTTVAPLSVSVGDFPPAAAVQAGQIRYTMFISVDNPLSIAFQYLLTGPAVFNGVATAGTT